ncbi:hypothetical protein AYO45_02995 [Gammaproteobacteria bacterium SCGC AG-212-F23]|nr:hypothetical protein AYO45_02995 [Gammaproteobacteria bacterium SCGC AG-212-F23]
MKKLITNLQNNNAELEKCLRSAQGAIFRTTDGWQKAIGDLQREQIHSEKLEKQMEYERSLSDARIKDLELQLLSLQKPQGANNQPAIASTTTSVSVESSVSQPATATTSATLAANNMWTSPPTSTSTAASTTSTSSGPLTDPKTPVFNG